jgi:hypothetical protein
VKGGDTIQTKKMLTDDTADFYDIFNKAFT